MKHILGLLLAISLYKPSSAQQSNQMVLPITYHVFDSVETFLCKAVKWKLKTEDSVFIAIEQLPQTSKAIYRIFVIGYSDEPWSSNVSRSNRKMQIYDKTYPIYIIGMDQLFEDDPIDRNPINQLSFPQEIVKRRSPYVEVDLLGKKYKINGPLFE